MPPRVSQKEIARAAGVHPTTVSLALRDSPRLPAETRERVKKLALELGYQPDPLLDALNAYRLAGRKRHFQGVLAWIDCWQWDLGCNNTTIFRDGALASLFASAKRHAESNGFQVEEFRLGRGGHGGLTASRLSTMLRERGIQGLIVPPVPGGRAHLNLRWEWFSSVALGFSLARPDLHRIAHDNFNNMRLLIRGVRHRGCRRPGLVIIRHENLRTDTQRLAAYELHGHPSSSKAGQIVPVLHLERFEGSALVAWYKKHKPDCILVQNFRDTVAHLAAAGIHCPGDVLVATCGAQDQPGAPGIVENIDEISKIAVQHLAGQIRRGETGLPSSPLRMLVTGAWTDGDLPAA